MYHSSFIQVNALFFVQVLPGLAARSGEGDAAHQKLAVSGYCLEEVKIFILYLNCLIAAGSLLRIRWCGSVPAELYTWIYHVFLF
jgi:hypothetical protein